MPPITFSKAFDYLMPDVVAHNQGAEDVAGGPGQALGEELIDCTAMLQITGGPHIVNVAMKG